MKEATLTIKKHRKSFSSYIFLPADLVNDSAYPFKENQEVKVKIEEKRKRLVVEAA